MKEILCLQVGQCGNAMGTQFWDLICSEHGINQAGCYIGKEDFQLQNIQVYFSENRGLRYNPRAVMIDLDKSSMVAVRSAPYGQIFKEKNFVFGNQGTGCNWAVSHFTEGVQLCSNSLDVIRKEIEACDYFYGFQMAHSVGGGTGGGLGSLLLEKLMDEYPKNIRSTFTVMPSLTVSSCVVEPYNSILSVNQLIESTHETFCFDNDSLFSAASNTLKLKEVSFRDLNHCIALVISGITTSMRFSGPLNTNFKKIAVNMVPFPRLHFLISGYSPLLSKSVRPHRMFSLSEVVTDLFDPKNIFGTMGGKFLTVTSLFRGEISMGYLQKHLYNIQNRNSPNFVEWVPDNMKTAICYVPPLGSSISGTFVGNTTGVQNTFENIRSQFLRLFKRKAFLHWFTNEGMEEMEFHAAEANVNDLIQEYQEYEVLENKVSITSNK